MEEALRLTKMSGPGEGDPRRPARSPDIARLSLWGDRPGADMEGGKR